MKRIVSYFGNLYFDAFQEHVKEIKEKGFNIILFCITETDVLYNLKTFHEFRMYADNEGLQCWCTFWGLTAGEAVCKDGNIDNWLTAVKDEGFNNIFIDEPKSFNDVLLFTKHKELFQFHLCLTDDTFHKTSDDDIVKIEVNSIGVSCYHWVKDWMKITMRTEHIAKRINRLRPKDNFLFIQGFDIPEGWELIPLIVKEIAEINNIENFGFWSFRCTAATSSKRPFNHKEIWKTIKF
jgi:hypothetical protein